MKTSFRFVIAAFMCSATLISSCEKQEGNLSTSEPINSTTSVESALQRIDAGSSTSGTSCVNMLAGQTINVGSVCVEDIDTDGDGEKDAIRVCYNISGGWTLREVHLWVGTSLTQMPRTNSGNPIPGQFPINSGNISGQTSYCAEISFASLGFSCPGPTQFLVAAHAVVRNQSGGTETAWGEGPRINTRGNWGTYFPIWITCDENPPPPPSNCVCETAWAKDPNQSECFLGFSCLNANRWGWSNGPYAPGIYTMELWAAAGQCNTANGTLVGTVTLNYSGSSATVTYQLNYPSTGGCTPYLESAHTYLGSNPLPGYPNNCTVAPGQLGSTASFTGGITTTHTFQYSNLNGSPIYLLAHADVCGIAE
ncbi:MAG: hypothetical protein ACK5C5_11430 [Bacteroidota bacterium]